MREKIIDDKGMEHSVLNMKIAAIVPSAGKGKRLKSKIQKPYIKINGKPILFYTLKALSGEKSIKEIILSVDSNKIKFVKKFIIDKYKLKKVKVISGGRERKDSVFNALKNISKDIGYVLIHDGVRPFIKRDILKKSIKAAIKFKASVVGVPVKPTLKYVTKSGFIKFTPARIDYWEAQTPQVFKKDLIEKAYKVHKCKSAQVHNKVNITDDAMLVESLGIKPKMVLGCYSNIKITTKEDLKLAKQLLIKN